MSGAGSRSWWSSSGRSTPAVCDLCAVYVNREQRGAQGDPYETAFKKNVKLDESWRP